MLGKGISIHGMERSVLFIFPSCLDKRDFLFLNHLDSTMRERRLERTFWSKYQIWGGAQ